MEVRIGVTQSPKEIALELAEDVDRDELKGRVGAVLADDDAVLWIADRRGREVAVASSRIAYVEIGSPDEDRHIGFGAP